MDQLQNFAALLDGVNKVSLAGVGIYLLLALIRRDKAMDARVLTMLEEEKKLRDGNQTEITTLRQEMREDQQHCAESLTRIGNKLDEVEKREHDCLQRNMQLMETLIKKQRK